MLTAKKHHLPKMKDGHMGLVSGIKEVFAEYVSPDLSCHRWRRGTR